MKLSIITINYNNFDGLRRTIESVLPQKKNQDFEYIIIDGYSTDKSVNLIGTHAEHIDYWVSEPDTGIYNAMNKGIKAAKGEYLLFLNSGDIINQETNIKNLFVQLTGEDLIYYDIKIATDVTASSFLIKKCPDFLDFSFFIKEALPHQSTFIKREKLVQYGGYSENMKIFGDWAFFMDAVCKMNCTYKHVPNVFTTFFEDGISSEPKNQELLKSELKHYIETEYAPYNRIFEEWDKQRTELHKLRSSRAIKLIKKIGFLKWFKTY